MLHYRISQKAAWDVTEKAIPHQCATSSRTAGPILYTASAAFVIGLGIVLWSGFVAVRAVRCDVELTAPERICPNTATAPSLMRLPGVGRVRAMDIVKAQSDSPYDSAAELERIRGIGPKTVENIEPYLIFEDRVQ